MTIMIIQGPQAQARSLSRELLGHLKQLALAAGRTVEICTCNGLREFVARVRSARPQDTEFMLLAPGTLTQQVVHTHAEEELGAALDTLRVPYIEVQDEDADALEQGGSCRRAPLATVVVGDDVHISYRIALGIALKRLSV